MIDVCAGVDIDERPTYLIAPSNADKVWEARPPRAVAVATPCDADAPGVADDPAGEGKRATVGESLRNFEKGG